LIQKRFNKYNTGYYRVNYDKRNWQKIAHYLNSEEYTKIHVLNRAQIIIDAFAFLRENQISGFVFLNITNYLSRETDYVPWFTMFRIFKWLSKSFLLPESTNIKVNSNFRKDKKDVCRIIINSSQFVQIYIYISYVNKLLLCKYHTLNMLSIIY